MSSTGSEASKWTSVWPNSVTKQVGDTDPTSSMSSLSSLVEPLHRSSSIPSSSDRSTSISSGLLATMSMHSCLGKPLESWFQIYSSKMRPQQTFASRRGRGRVLLHLDRRPLLAVTLLLRSLPGRSDELRHLTLQTLKSLCHS